MTNESLSHLRPPGHRQHPYLIAILICVSVLNFVSLSAKMCTANSLHKNETTAVSTYSSLLQSVLSCPDPGYLDCWQHCQIGIALVVDQPRYSSRPSNALLFTQSYTVSPITSEPLLPPPISIRLETRNLT